MLALTLWPLHCNVAALVVPDAELGLGSPIGSPCGVNEKLEGRGWSFVPKDGESSEGNASRQTNFGSNGGRCKSPLTVLSARDF